MTFSTYIGSAHELAVDSLVVFVPQTDQPALPLLKQLDRVNSGMVKALYASGEFTGKLEQTTMLRNCSGFAADRIVLVGLGKPADLTGEAYRRAAGRVSRERAVKRGTTVGLVLDRFEDESYVQAAVEGFMLGSWEFRQFKSGDARKNENRLESIQVVLPDNRSTKKVNRAIETAQIAAEGQLLGRELGTTPSNYLTPRDLAERARLLAKQHGFSCRILDEKGIEKERMGALLSVARGSVEPPRFIILEYTGGQDKRSPIVLVGKGVTFDTGGISLKPALDMHEMKGDMSGAAVVLATIVCAARLGLPQHIVGLIPTTENMPSGSATKPGDIVTSRKGKTIEIINTDAEGRLILADALDYANTFNPQAVIDIATLTGAALFILGYAGAPILGNNEKLINQVREAADVTGERVWPLPIWDDHRDRMKSSVADLVNSAGKTAGTICAAAFLENFIGNYPWLHIDIAYVDVEPAGSAYTDKGVTGFGCRLLLSVLRNWKKV